MKLKELVEVLPSSAWKYLNMRVSMVDFVDILKPKLFQVRVEMEEVKE